jgi:hypothetical protein
MQTVLDIRYFIYTLKFTNKQQEHATYVAAEAVKLDFGCGLQPF